MNRVLQFLRRESETLATSGTPTDQELLEKYLSRNDQAAFGELVRRHELSVTKACRQVLRSPVDVDDAFQATFLVLLRRARQIRWQPSIRGWLIAVAHRIAVRLAVSQQRSATVHLSQEPSDGSKPVAEVSWQEACAVLHEELNRLRDAYRLPLLLCYLQGLSRDEAAEQLGWSLGSVKAGLERGRAQLKSRLERRGVTLSAGLLTLLARPMTIEAGTALLSARTVEALTGAIPSKISSLAHQAGIAGFFWNGRLAILLTLVLLTAAGGVSYVWVKKLEQTASNPITSPVTIPITSPAVDQQGSTHVTGMVLDPSGKPASGATVMVSMKPIRTARPSDTIVTPADQKVNTDAEGKFQITLKTLPCHLVAQKPGFGLDFMVVTADKAAQPLKMQLGEEMPLQGQVLDEARQPVEGATIGIESIRRFTTGELEDALEKVRETGDSNALYRANDEYLLVQLGSLVTAKSDSAGRFTLRGLPVGAVSQLTYSKPGLVSHSLLVALAPGFDKAGTPRNKLTASIIDDAVLKREGQNLNETIDQTRQRLRQLGYGRLIEGASLDISMRKGVTLEGTVRNLQGQPLAGVMVWTSGRATAVTNQQGHYVLNDVRPGESYMVETSPQDRYLVAKGSAVHRIGGPIRIDLLARPGAILRGKVNDGQTGKGVKSLVQVEPTPGNPLLNKQNVQQECSVSTESDGTFRLVAPPGDVIVTATPDVWSQNSGPSPYVPAKLLPSHSGVVNSTQGGQDTVIFQNAGKSYQLRYAYQLLELPADGETTVELTMTRGKERTLNLVDPQGKPIPKVLIAGLDQSMTPYTIEGATHLIVGLTATERNRMLFIIDREQKLGALVELNKNEATPLTVRLEPLGSFTARLIDNQGKPHAHLRLALKPQPPDLSRGPNYVRLDWNHQMLDTFFPPVTTDNDGRFTITDIIPGMDFVLSPADRPGNFTGVDLSTRRRVKPGEKLTARDLKFQEISGRPFNR